MSSGNITLCERALSLLTVRDILLTGSRWANMDGAKLPQQLKALREKRGLTQRGLAAQLQVSPATVALYETGNRRPDPDMLTKLADFFGVTTDSLLGRTDDQGTAPSDVAQLPHDLRTIARAGQKMTPEQRRDWLKFAKTFFPEAFEDDKPKDP